MNHKELVMTAVVAAIAVMLVGSVLVYTGNAEAKSKTGKIKVTYINVDYFGKAKLTITNEETGKIIVKADLNFAKQLKSQGDDCCKKTYEFKWKGNHVGDEITPKVKISNGNFFESQDFLKSGTSSAFIYIEGIGE